MEDRVNKPKRKKCPGSGKMSLPVERSYFGGVHHMCPDCGGYVGATEKKYSAPITVRPHMVNVKAETPPNTGLQADRAVCTTPWACPNFACPVCDFSYQGCRPAAKA